MIMSYSLILVSLAAVGCCWGAMIPNLMFARPLPTNNHQQHPWRSAGVPETYANNGFNLMMAAAPVSAVERPVYGIPHRYLSDATSYYYDPSEDLYNDPLFRHPSWPVKSKRGSSYYNLMSEDDYSPTNQDWPTEPKISQQDVINFEKYVQRYFQQQAQDKDQSLETEESGYDAQDEEEVIDNDDEAARQLHLLLQQQKRPTIREIKKKSVAEVTTTMAPSTTELTPPSTPQSSVSEGQKEEAMLRPPTQRPISPLTKPPKEAEKEEDTDIYKTIHRLMAMRNHLEKQEEGESKNRMKRFVAPSQDSIFNKQLHLLNKIKA